MNARVPEGGGSNGPKRARVEIIFRGDRLPMPVDEERRDPEKTRQEQIIGVKMRVLEQILKVLRELQAKGGGKVSFATRNEPLFPSEEADDAAFRNEVFAAIWKDLPPLFAKLLGPPRP